MTEADARARSDAACAVALQLHGSQRAVALRADLQSLQAARAIADGHVLFAPIEHEAHWRARLARQVDRERAVVADAVFRAEAAAGEFAEHTNLVWRKTENLRRLRRARSTCTASTRRSSAHRRANRRRSRASPSARASVLACGTPPSTMTSASQSPGRRRRAAFFAGPRRLPCCPRPGAAPPPPAVAGCSVGPGKIAGASAASPVRVDDVRQRFVFDTHQPCCFARGAC